MLALQAIYVNTIDTLIVLYWEPNEVAYAASVALGLKTAYLDLIKEAKVGFEFFAARHRPPLQVVSKCRLEKI